MARNGFVQNLLKRKGLGVLLAALALCSGISEAHGALEIRILARVADTSISNRDMIIEWLLQNPKSYVKGRRNYFSKPVEDRLLQERLVQTLVEEENRIVGTESVSNTAIERELLRVKRAFGPRWEVFLEDFGVSELDVRNSLARALLVDQTLQSRLNDSLRGLPKQDASALNKAEDSLQSWLQQLRSRYRVQIFRY